MDIVKTVSTEIALCGLEGLTLPNLWKLLSEKEPPLLVTDDEDYKSFIWQGIVQCSEIEFWWLNLDKKEKDKGKKSDKKKKKDIKSSDLNDDDVGSNDNIALPKEWIIDTDNEVYGYCPDYDLRENVTDDIRKSSLTYTDVYSKWQDNVFIIATQALRRRTLLGECLPVDIGITPARYIFLDIIGKARERGFLQKDFREFSLDPRTSFHHIKILVTMGLITKQLITLKRGKGVNGNNVQIRTNILFLMRFHKEMLGEHEVLSKKMFKILTGAPGNIIELSELREKLACSRKLFNSIRKSCYNNSSIQYIQDGKVYNYKNGEEALMHRFNPAIPLYVQLIKPFKKSAGGDDYDDDAIEEDEESDFISNCKFTEPQFIRDVPLLQQAYWVIHSAKQRGVTIDGFGALTCVPYYTSRSLTRQLKRRGSVQLLNTEISRQKVYRYISKTYVEQNEQIQKLAAERGKAKDFKLAGSGIENGAIEDENKGSANSSMNLANDENEKTGQESTVESIGSAKEEQLEPAKKIEEEKVKKPDMATLRGMRRQNKILEKIRELKVIEGSNQIYKAVLQEEQQLGIKEKVCRKSVKRILNRMSDEGLIKTIEIVIADDNGPSKTTVYFCDSNIKIEDNIFKTAVNETKFRIRGIHENRQQRKMPKLKESPTNVSLFDIADDNEATNGAETDTDDEEYEPVTGSGYQRPQYGFLARFSRLKMLHFYIWQLVYGHEVRPTREELFNIQEFGENFNWLSDLHQVPENRYGKGYFQTGDALTIMPLVVFTKCIGICIKSNTIEKLLADPEKRNTPLRDLPPRLKAKIFAKRSISTYVGHFVESLILLTHMGLVHITPEKLPANRTQIVLFVSKMAMLMDTTMSEKGYSKTRLPPSMTSFPKQRYKLDCISTMCRYWKEMQYICLNTRLGLLRGLRKAKDEPEDEQRGKRPRPSRTFMTLRDLQEHFPATDPMNAEPKLFGDGLGAAGFDSSLFGHLAKNWAYTESKMRKVAMLNENVTECKFEQRTAVPLQGFGQRTSQSVVTKARVHDGGKGKKRKRVFDNKIMAEAGLVKKAKIDDKQESMESIDSKLKKFMAVRYRQKLSKVMKSGQKPPKDRGNKCKKDDIDLAAIKRKVSVRVSFSSREDAAILMCRIAADLLGLDLKKVNYWQVARNIIHKEIPESNDKTTEALGRRNRYMLKNPETLHNFKSCVLECKSDPKFGVEKITSKKDDGWKLAFRECYEKVRTRFRRKLAPVGIKHDVPDTMEELHEKFVVSKSFEKEMSAASYNRDKRPTSKEINLCVLEQIIHNSLAGQNQKEYVPSLVFHVFDRYPTKFLEEALVSLKAKSLITRMRLKVPRRRALPISTMTYGLSVYYERIFEMPTPNNLFNAARNFMKLLRDGSKHVGRSLHLKNSTKSSDAGKMTDDIAKQPSVEENDIMRNPIKGNEAIAQKADEKLHDESKIAKGNQTPTNGSQHVESASQSSTNTPGTLVYSKEECFGGHLASIFSMVICKKGFFDIAIPDDIVDCDQILIGKKAEIREKNSTTSLTLLKRKLYSENVEDALVSSENLDKENEIDFDEIEDSLQGSFTSEDVEKETANIENEERDDDDDDDNLEDLSGKQHHKMADILEMSKDKDMDNVSEKWSQSESKNEDSCTGFEVLESVSSLEHSDKISKQTSSCLKSSFQTTANGDESAVPKKKRKVTFDDELSWSGPPSPRGETSTERADTEGRTIDSDSESLRKRPKIGINESAKKESHLSNILNFNINSAAGSFKFMSDRFFVDKYKDSADSKWCSLKPDCIYNDEQQGFVKSGSNFVPKRSLTVQKTKMHASRTTLMLHRALEQDPDPSQNRMFLAHESLVLNPVDITCHLQLQPHSDDSMKMVDIFERSHEDGEENESPGPDSPIRRFFETKPVALSKFDLEKGFGSINNFTSLMEKHYRWNEKEVEFAKSIARMIAKKEELGLTEEEISNFYMKYKGLRPMEEILDMFVNLNVLLRVGTHNVRFVSPEFASNWCITTPYRNSKGDHKGKTKTDHATSIAGNVTKERICDEGRRNEDCAVSNACLFSQKEVIETNKDFIATKKQDDRNCGLYKEEDSAGRKEALRGNEAILSMDENEDIKKNETRSKEKLQMPGETDDQNNQKTEINTQLKPYDPARVDESDARYQRVVCRPWLKLNCDFNHVVLRRFQRAILSLIMVCPGITESAIMGHFRTVLTRLATKELLSFLELNGCITKHPSGSKKKPRLFDPPGFSMTFDPADDDPYFLPTASCVLNLAD